MLNAVQYSYQVLPYCYSIARQTQSIDLRLLTLNTGDQRIMQISTG